RMGIVGCLVKAIGAEGVARIPCRWREGSLGSAGSAGSSPRSKVQGPKPKVQGPKPKVQGPKPKVQSPRSKVRGPRLDRSAVAAGSGDPRRTRLRPAPNKVEA